MQLLRTQLCPISHKGPEAVTPASRVHRRPESELIDDCDRRTDGSTDDVRWRQRYSRNGQVTAPSGLVCCRSLNECRKRFKFVALWLTLNWKKTQKV
ncbi:MAG: hypothetical protein ACI92S_005388 [Planctomycetaceae bacterium]|jgi:hypothetical protein